MANEVMPASAGSGELCPQVELPAKLRKPRLRSDEASLYLELMHGLRISKATLNKWRSTRSDGPPFVKFGATCLYERIALDQWAAANISTPRRSTSHNGAPQ